jgi:hypothetical protein
MSRLTRPRHEEDFHRSALDQAERRGAMARMHPNAPLDRALGGWLPERRPG